MPSRSDAPSVLPLADADLEQLHQLARRRLRSRGLASPRLDHHGSRTLDPQPRLFEVGAWRSVEAVVQQRVRLLAAVADDLYGDQRSLTDGVLPADVVFANPAFTLAAAGWAPATGRRLALVAVDLVCDPDEGWTPVADRVCAPTQLGRALENREILTQLLPGELHRRRIRRLAHFQAALRQSYAGLAPPTTDAPRVLLLSPGPQDHDHPELAELARLLGYTVAEAADLTVRRGALFLSSLSGLEPVHVLARFTPDRGADPLELTGEGSTGIAGLLAATRRGTATVANALGTGVLEEASLAPWWPSLCRALLGEELRSASQPAWWCGDPTGRAHALAQLDALVFDPIDGDAVDGRLLDAGRRRELAARVEARPWAWSARRPLDPSTEVVRTFAVFDGNEVTVMPGGYAIAAGDGATSSDVWVPQAEGSRFIDLPVRVAGLAQVDFAISLPSRAGESMFWLGRHLERAEAIVRLTRTVIDRAEQESLSELPGWMADLSEAVDRLTGIGYGGGLALSTVDGALRDPQRWEGLPSTVSQLLTTAGSARELLSVEVWDGLTALRDDVALLAGTDVAADLGLTRDRLDGMLANLASVAGVVHESMLRGPGWRLLDAGRRIERAQNLVMLLDTLLHARPGQVEDEILEALLTTGVSLVAYRRRHRSDLELEAVLAILVLDDSNPRSVRHCVDSLVEDIAELPVPQRSGAREATLGRARELAELVRSLRPASLANRFPSERPGDDLPRTLHAIGEALLAVSEALQDVYMRHVTMARLPRQTGTAHQTDTAHRTGTDVTPPPPEHR
ncbi:MAG: circularly permuted type 2 ATP-grasp protein [Acidimicrobiia bacterium]